MAQITDGKFFDSVITAFEDGDPDAASKHREADHVRCVQLMYHAIGRQAFDQCLEMATDDFVLEIVGPETSPMVGRWQGKPDVLAAMEHNFGLVEDQRPSIRSVTAQGNSVVIIATEQGPICASCAPYKVEWVQEFTFSNGKVCSVREVITGDTDFAEPI